MSLVTKLDYRQIAGSDTRVGEILDQADGAVKELRDNDPDEFARSLKEMHQQDVEQLVTELARNIAGGDADTPEMQALHETLVGEGLLTGIFGGALNYVVKTMPKTAAAAEEEPPEEPPSDRARLESVLVDADDFSMGMYADDPAAATEALEEFRNLGAEALAKEIADGIDPGDDPLMQRLHEALVTGAFIVGAMAGALHHAAIPAGVAAVKTAA